MSLEKVAMTLAATCSSHTRWDHEVAEFPSIGFITKSLHAADSTLQTISSYSFLVNNVQLPDMAYTQAK